MAVLVIGRRHGTVSLSYHIFTIIYNADPHPHPLHIDHGRKWPHSLGQQHPLWLEEHLPSRLLLTLGGRTHSRPTRIYILMQRIAKDELTPDVVAFIKTTPQAVTFDFNQLRREFQVDDIDL